MKWNQAYERKTREHGWDYRTVYSLIACQSTLGQLHSNTIPLNQKERRATAPDDKLARFPFAAHKFVIVGSFACMKENACIQFLPATEPEIGIR